MINYRSDDFEAGIQPPFSSNLVSCWLSRFPSATARREEAEYLAEMTQGELDTLGLSRREICAYLGRPR